MNTPNQKIQAKAQNYYVRWRSCFVAAILVAMLGGTVDAAPLTFDDPTPTFNNFFGRPVALDDDNVLIGDRNDNTHGTDIGQAHLFSAGSGNLQRTFNSIFDPITTDQFARFGTKLAIDGNNVLISAPSNDLAYLLDAVTGNLLQTFSNPNPTSDDRFGSSSVALDGNNVLIGAYRNDTIGENIGQAYLFDATTGNLVNTFNDPTPTTEDFFGLSVALEGNNVLIGAYGDDTFGENVGQAFLFDTTGDLLRTFDNPTPTTDDLFGRSVALDGNNVLIGATGDDTLGDDVGQAYLFDALTGNLLQTFDDPTPTGGDGFGESLALDGNNVLIGAYHDNTFGDNVGQAHLFDAVTGNLLRTFNDPIVTTGDAFGQSVAIDGNNILISDSGDDTFGPGVGKAHLFYITEPPPEPTADFNSDNSVNDSDLSIWETNFGLADPFGHPLPEHGDADTDTDIDGIDFLIWQREFGYGLAAPAIAASVPEPSGIVLALLAASGLLQRGRENS